MRYNVFFGLISLLFFFFISPLNGPVFSFIFYIFKLPTSAIDKKKHFSKAVYSKVNKIRQRYMKTAIMGLDVALKA
jgi:hypothetical protein